MHNLMRLSRFLFSEEKLPLETIMLLIGGLALSITGCLLFFVSNLGLPYYEEVFFGLLLIVFALQTITLGKTPFGDMGRSKALLISGLVIGSVGMIACFIPGLFRSLSRILLLICFGLGGIVQLWRAYRDETGMRAWLRRGGIFRHLFLACFGTYGLSILAGLLLWMQPPLPTPCTAASLVLFGLVVIYLAGVLRLVYHVYPQADSAGGNGDGLSLDNCMLLFIGVFMILLGLLLIPVNLGLAPFAANAQLGLLMIIFAIQMLASGNTPIGPFPRSLVVIGLGILFALLGIVSCVIPDILVAFLTILVGVLNILGALIPLGKQLLFSPKRQNADAAPVHPLLRKLSITQLVMKMLAILFGLSMLVPNIIPGLAVGAILIANGAVLLYLLRLLTAIDVLAREAVNAS